MNLVAESVSLQIIESLRAVLARVQRCDTDLARQLRKAASSIALNVSEGERRRGKDRLHHFRVAAGSAKETVAALRVACAWGFVDDRDVAPALQLLDRQLGLLWGLTERRQRG